MDHIELWDKAKALMREELANVSYTTWIEQPLKPVYVVDDKLALEVISDFNEKTIRARYLPMITEAVSQAAGREMTIELMSVKERIEWQERQKKEDAPAMQGINMFNPKSTFDTFVVGSSNRVAHAAALAVAEQPGMAYNPLVLYGGVGLGKTHLMHAIANQVHENHPEYKIIYVTSEEFGNDFLSCINDNNMARFHDKYRNADVLLIDDIQFFSNKERMQEEFFHTFNKLHAEGKQIVITSDKPPKELKTLEERIRSRFEWGLITDISTPDFETRIAIIRRKAELLDLYIPDDVAEFIANRLKTNIRQLEGAVKKLKALKHLAGSPPSISMAQSVIKDILSDDQPAPITVEKIILEVADVYGVSPEDIRSSKRSSQISTARKVAIYVVREITQMPLQAIGTEFGGRDHSTIVYSISNIETAMKHDDHLKQLVEDTIKNIRNKSHA